MTAETPSIAGPPCDGCGDEFAAMSLLSYGDYSQVKVGVNCAPNFLRTIADSMDGRSTAEPQPDPDAEPAAGTQDDPTPAGVEPDPEIELRLGGRAPGLYVDGDRIESPDDDPGPPGSAKDHWASTTNVRRSTHGHRSPRGATGKPREDTPE